MKLHWYISADAWLYNMLSGQFYVSTGKGFSTVRDSLLGYNALRVEWEKTDSRFLEDRIEIMNNLLLAVEVRYNDMKDKYGTAV